MMCYYRPVLMDEYINLGKWTERDINKLLQESSNIKDTGERIEFISRQFIGTPYKESTLIGDMNNPEVLVINLEGVDCLTFIEYVEAMRLSSSFSKFKDNLRSLRYKSGIVSFTNRNHFFTDWREYNSPFVMDVTEDIGNTIEELKVLNKKDDNSYILNGITPVNRRIRYIPADNINSESIKKLIMGDYVGIYSVENGLDVSHVGIIIKDKEVVYLRHASKRYGKVIDEGFKDYISHKPGLIVLKPMDTP